jgi:hypothetical protein
MNANYFSTAMTDNGVYAGPYTASIVGANSSPGAQIAMICDNYDTGVSTGSDGWLRE